MNTHRKLPKATQPPHAFTIPVQLVSDPRQVLLPLVRREPFRGNGVQQPERVVAERPLVGLGHVALGVDDGARCLP
jgi:hypothetical protein